VVLIKVFGGKQGIYNVKHLTYEMSTESLDKTIVEPFEIRVSPGHRPLKWEGGDRVDGEALFEKSSLDYLRLRDRKVHQSRID
jgi:hypothetical protein